MACLGEASNLVVAPEPPARYSSLDGLRGIAVGLVFLQHYAAGRVALFGWGWAGVDIFFVLSGFLITGILYDSKDKPFRYRDFYMRRTLRIFPLYYAIWLVLLILVPVVQWQWGRQWLLWPAYLGNYARFLFFGVGGDPYRFDRLTVGADVQQWFGSPMHLYIGHFWSLCVEEQFYLLWPLVVYQIRRRETLIKICLCIIVAVPLLRWWLTVVVPQPLLDMELLYRSMPTRVDALLLGGLIALYLRGPEQLWLKHRRRWLMLGSLLLLVALYEFSTRVLHLAFHGSATNWIGVWGFTLIDLFTASLILEATHPGGLLKQLLDLPWLQNFGVISYGFYVYHDLLHDFYAYVGSTFFRPHAYLATLVVAFVSSWLIAWLSYRLLELPFLKLKNRFAHQAHNAPAV